MKKTRGPEFCHASPTGKHRGEFWCEWCGDEVETVRGEVRSVGPFPLRAPSPPTAVEQADGS